MTSKEFKVLWEAITELRTIVLMTTPSTSEEVFLTSNQVMKMLNISKSTLYRMRVNKFITPVMVHKRYYYPKSLITQEILERAQRIQDQSNFFDES
ncbi:helix-turn-helix domain-containing protein [Flavobacterium sp. RSB2_4_14]|uniref:helix-turn-helix domain-containing protein n=1 Tax=Flavobacterium sp. RSB2_4_14 TaxID=3447665 RepID=UPI003F2D3FB3